jgi:NADH:ubiquinone oxidoreductase subunit C
MLLACESIFKVLPIIRFELYNKESSFLIQTNLITEILTVFKTHFSYQFKILTCISGVDYLKNLYRFQVVYELLSIKYNSRIRLKLFVDELTPVNTIEKIYPAATWWESEIWDMFGIFFYNQYNLTRLLTDYGFQGYPLRKDFPLTGFLEARFNYPKNRVAYENLELAQEYRTFIYLSPWETYKNSLCKNYYKKI